MGKVEKARMMKAIDQLAENYEFDNKPDFTSYFTDLYLPKDGSLMIK